MHMLGRCSFKKCDSSRLFMDSSVYLVESFYRKNMKVWGAWAP
jgi:hypothetical protein